MMQVTKVMINTHGCIVSSPRMTEVVMLDRKHVAAIFIFCQRVVSAATLSFLSLIRKAMMLMLLSSK